MSKTTEQDVAFIRALADLLHQSELAEIEVEREYGEDDELKVRLVRTRAPEPAPTAAPAYHALYAPAPANGAMAAPSAPQGEPSAQPPSPTADAEERKANTVSSPMVGTAYLSPEPGADPFVQVGDSVKEGDTLLIIEAMKTMNQIPSPRSGTVKEILVSNAEPVEFGAPLIVVA